MGFASVKKESICNFLSVRVGCRQNPLVGHVLKDVREKVGPLFRFSNYFLALSEHEDQSFQIST